MKLFERNGDVYATNTFWRRLNDGQLVVTSIHQYGSAYSVVLIQIPQLLAEVCWALRLLM